MMTLVRATKSNLELQHLLPRVARQGSYALALGSGPYYDTLIVPSTYFTRERHVIWLVHNSVWWRRYIISSSETD